MEKQNILEVSQNLGNDFDLPYYIYFKVKSDTNEKVISPLKIGLKITNACHFRCPYCFVIKEEDYLSFDNLKIVMSKLPQLPYEVYLTGGEATLHPEFSKIVNYLVELGILVKLHTTGVIPEKNRTYIISNLEKFSSIQISIDSIKNFDKLRPNHIDTNPLDKICSFVKECLSRDYKKLLVNIVVSSLNINELDEIIDFCYNHGLVRIHLSSIFSINSRLLVSDEKYATHYNKIILKYSNLGYNFLTSPFCHPWSLAIKSRIEYNSPLYCPAQKTEFEIDMHGDVYPCPFLHDETHFMGNLITEDFEKVWYSGVDKLNRTAWSNDDKCKNCKLFNDCGGGCYAMAFASKLEYDKRCILHENK
ncbi:radical SAM/SPASM domain-containing protein [Streptococcus sanguinis]|uniref:Radical SAM protein n=1 Tax=Streptococcus sanguinis TaxID=1305 RepID=A0A7H8UZQ7_STRSA|nr:radical SAM protein [Streptococcus sanguinis]QLB49875.1 radical SAM protein [Streptococcus sanguinis]